MKNLLIKVQGQLYLEKPCSKAVVLAQLLIGPSYFLYNSPIPFLQNICHLILKSLLIHMMTIRKNILPNNTHTHVPIQLNNKRQIAQG